MKNVLWKPKNFKKTRMIQFLDRINNLYDLDIKSYEDLHRWSVENIADFWKEIWDISEIIYSKNYNEIVDDIHKMPGAKWFSGSRINFAENLLRFRDDQVAIYFQSENFTEQTITYKELYDKVSALAESLRSIGVRKDDRIVGYLPNIPETVVAMLATTSLGAIWSSCSPDFGIKGALDRFKQIEPKVVFAADGYVYNGKNFDSLKKLEKILIQLESVNKVILVDYIKKNQNKIVIPNSIKYDDFLSNSPKPIKFEQLPFNHPAYIMYSSGTTGLPKSIVHSSGGTLIQHWKELALHCNLKRQDCIFYFTSCGWMMWNWLISSLSIGCSIVLYDGSPFSPNGKRLWELADKLEISVFGTSAKFLSSCNHAEIKPINFSNLSRLRMILSTGSPLTNEGFDYVYNNVKKDLLLGSISGGTDIISCFALANPILPVYKGELQCKGLGMDIHAFDNYGNSIINDKGELVCKSPFPSMPIYFWNDPNGEKYRNAYFSKFENIWCHGDYIRITEKGTIKIFGRSDATLNPGGVRIGTSEIYRIVENISGIEDSLVIGQEWKNDQRIILFLKMKDGLSLTTHLIEKIKLEIKEYCSPRHVPELILETKGIPYTINGKKVEIAVKKILHGEEVPNTDSLENPSVLDLYKDIKILSN